MKELILAGILPLPNYRGFKEVIGDDIIIADRMFKALWQNYLKNKGSISLPYWADKFESISNFNVVLKSLSVAGWIVSNAIPARNWAEASLKEAKLLEYVTADELEQLRAHLKIKHYVLSNTVSTKDSATKINGVTKNTGLVRRGSMLAGNTRFSFDKITMEAFYEDIQKELTKGMDKVVALIRSSGGNVLLDKASYDAISIQIMDYYYNSNLYYTRGNCYNDSRGRAISDSLTKVGNPIGNKTFRALLVIE